MHRHTINEVQVFKASIVNVFREHHMRETWGLLVWKERGLIG